jgi:hypothetical protein
MLNVASSTKNSLREILRELRIKNNK